MNTIYLDNNQYKFLVISLKVKLDYFNEICVTKLQLYLALDTQLYKAV
jgi:hypothetical protein